MKNRILHATQVLLVLFLFLASCDKTEDLAKDPQPDTEPTPQPVDVTPKPGDASGVLVAIKTLSFTSSPIGDIKTELGVATAFFAENPGDFSTYEAVGDVSVNNENLKKQDNNTYAYQPAQTNPTGINFSNGADWKVTGGGSTGAINESVDDFPSKDPNITSGDIDMSKDYTLTIKEAIGNCDSIYFNIYSADGNLMRTTVSGKSSYTFTSAEPATLKATDYGMIQVVAIKMIPKTLNGKVYYFINETVTTKMVKIK